MRRLIKAALAAVLLATVLSTFAVVWMPGCGIVDIWLYISYGCPDPSSSGGGGGGGW